MILAAHQPQFMPWLGYFNKMAHCDIFVLLDDVQFKKNEWQNRNRIWSKQGGQWLTVPVLHQFGQDLRSVRVNTLVDWTRKHIGTLKQVYTKAKYFKEYWLRWEEMYSRSYNFLLDINLYTIDALKDMLGIRTRTELSSTLKIEGHATERLVNLCRALKADIYLAGAGGKDYMELELFEHAGIKVLFQNFNCPVYAQFDGLFVPNLSAIDAVFHCGPKAAKFVARGTS